MKRSTLKRLGLNLIQHLLMAGILTIIAGLVLNSYFAVESVDGPKIYNILPSNTEEGFEESELYRDLFQSAVSDIIQLAFIRDMLEDNGKLDSSKKIDVTAYAKLLGKDQGCRATVIYELDDIIKWGRHGLEYRDAIMNMSEFVNFFGYCLFPENFNFDEYGQLVFDDFYRVENRADGSEAVPQEPAADPQEPPADLLEETGSGKSREELELLSQSLENYTTAQLEDLVFSHIMEKNLSDIDLYREDNGVLTVVVPMLMNRYIAGDGRERLTDYVDNWVDYIYLQHNVVTAVETLTKNYQQYQAHTETYRKENSNVRYMARRTLEGSVRTYTNLPELQSYNDYEVADFFSEYRRYLIYYPDSLVFMSNTDLSEEEVGELFKQYSYDDSDTLHIWLAVDTEYAVEGDIFYKANAVYQNIVPNIGRFAGAAALLVLIWLALTIYLTVTAGTAVDESGERILCLNRFDHVFTEIFCALALAAVYGILTGYRMILDVAATAGVMPVAVLGIQLTRLYRYSVFALYGLYISVVFNVFWYSLVRRVKAGSLWNGSLLKRVIKGFGGVVQFVFRHKNTVVSILLPYNGFLFLNLVGVVTVYRYLEEETMLNALLVVAGLVILDSMAGVLLVRRSAEQIEIADGISRIRDGEVDAKLDSESLHGANRELADAVNNIGEGIRKAVRTSMKDEQMKADLITNVSHDIKTPLTSIINYVDLLKRLKIEEEPAKKYIEILDGKAQRLKLLTDDLVEASKLSSGNIELNLEKLNLAELVSQGLGEYSERLEESGLTLVFEKHTPTGFIYADSRRMWRVMENLFNNICKYAMEGTRVYIDIVIRDGFVEAIVKNISRQKMNISPEELTERFIRGDSARSTEGSGLGLFIAQNLVQAQGGNFEIYLDGDLFKTTISFPEYQESEQPAKEE